MKEEYVEGILEIPTVIEERVPEQLKGALGQAVTTIQQLPLPIRDVVAGGLKVPLSKTLFTFFLIHLLYIEFKNEHLVHNQLVSPQNVIYKLICLTCETWND